VGVVGFDRGFEQEPNHDEALPTSPSTTCCWTGSEGVWRWGPDSRQRPSLMHSPATPAVAYAPGASGDEVIQPRHSCFRPKQEAFPGRRVRRCFTRTRQSISAKKIVTPPVAKLGMSLMAAWPASEPSTDCSASMFSNVSSAMRR
jgi:hypothetical protein